MVYYVNAMTLPGINWHQSRISGQQATCIMIFTRPDA